MASAAGNLVSKLNVNEEYMEAFRTKSYIEMSTKVKGQLKKRPATTAAAAARLSASPPPASLSHLSESLLEPRQETLAAMFEGSNLHRLLVDYFESSLQACEICESLLRCIHQTRSNYRIIGRAISLTRSAQKDRARSDPALEFGDLLRSFAVLKNPFSAVTAAQFREIRDRHKSLFRKLNSSSKRIRRKVKAIRIYKKAAGFGLVISYTAIATALFALIVHSIVGIVAAPGVIGGCSFVMKKKKVFSKPGNLRRRRGEGGGGGGGIGHETVTAKKRTGLQLDVAAKGVYILINDFDTMSRLMRRLHDQVEHGKAIAEICVRNGKGEVLKEVVKEFAAQERCFMEQLEELEEHVYLCFVNINRSRRLVIQQILAPQNT